VIFGGFAIANPLESRVAEAREINAGARGLFEHGLFSPIFRNLSPLTP